ncbi:MAG: hypothetical protein AXA67_11495 [Methylothermaceae bacteria B42]|nr:MAG: hypothetical protein AXA67_11495 [Methylothermaceae bacteria B42]HHJ39153.1 hypothetical protein [Methylothermaceae bacterium]
MTGFSRRKFVQYNLWLAGGLWLPKAISATSALEQTLQQLLHGQKPISHLGVGLIAPTTAESRMAVPIKIDCQLKQTDFMAVLVDNNPNPLVARINLNPKIMAPYFRTRVRVLMDSTIIAIVRANGRYYRQEAKISVTKGCD